jgi:glycosyltransferase involved in cell wall biosynthesis
MNGRLYSTFGLTALEAAALGKVVITCNAKRNLYENIFGNFAPIISNSRDDLIRELKNIILMNSNELSREKKKNRDWASEYHSYESFGKRLIKIYESL